MSSIGLNWAPRGCHLVCEMKALTSLLGHSCELKSWSRTTLPMMSTVRLVVAASIRKSSLVLARSSIIDEKTLQLSTMEGTRVIR